MAKNDNEKDQLCFYFMTKKEVATWWNYNIFDSSQDEEGLVKKCDSKIQTCWRLYANEHIFHGLKWQNGF